ncbi:MAG: c-type cytochrome [Proteobacteria bacterium]|nr:c-type cytochrome [Pseudomonadota bacterium]
MKDQDSIFFKNFSLMLGFLVLLTIALAVVSYMMHNDLLGRDDMAQDRSAIVEKLESVAQVNTGEAIVAQASSQAVAAFDGTLDGKTIYDNACMSCHLSGLAGAPKLVAADWTARMANGVETLITNSINGKGAMPPRGGRMDLSDEQMKAVVEFMTDGF